MGNVLTATQISKIREATRDVPDTAEGLKLTGLIWALLDHAETATITAVTDLAELKRLPVTSVVRTTQGYVMEKMSDGWYQPVIEDAYQPNEKWLPAQVLYRP